MQANREWISGPEPQQFAGRTLFGTPRDAASHDTRLSVPPRADVEPVAIRSGFLSGLARGCAAGDELSRERPPWFAVFLPAEIAGAAKNGPRTLAVISPRLRVVTECRSPVPERCR